MPSKSSRRWLKEHFSDTYVKKAQLEGYRSRAVYKLLELQQRDKLFKQGMTVVDLGSAPGGWSQLIAELIGPKGKIFALDILPMEPILGVTFIQGDFSEDQCLTRLWEVLGDSQVDWVVSDISPNLSGILHVDQTRSICLAELALEFAIKILPPSGGFLVKVFQGEGSDSFLKEIRKEFSKVRIRKPKASRGRSKEIYIIAQEKRNKNEV